MMARKIAPSGNIPRTWPRPRGPAARSPVMVPQMLAATIAAQYPASMVGRFRVRIQVSGQRETHKEKTAPLLRRRPKGSDLLSPRSILPSASAVLELCLLAVEVG